LGIFKTLLSKDGTEQEVVLKDVRAIDVGKLGPDDVIIARLKERAYPEQYAWIEETLRSTFGPDRKILVIEEGIELLVAQAEDPRR
jgi:hypothetical protein